MLLLYWSIFHSQHLRNQNGSGFHKVHKRTEHENAKEIQLSQSNITAKFDVNYDPVPQNT